jgi:hypothetical protein
MRSVACLAASIKHGGFCYAGKDVDTGQWIRPVCNENGSAIPAYFRVVGRGDPAKVGDVLTMSLGAHVRHGYQTENHEHRKQHWQRIRTFDFDQALAMADQPASLWGRGRSSAHGAHDDLTEAQADTFNFSLCMIEVNDLIVFCANEGYRDVKLRTRACFSYHGIQYRLTVTDPEHFNHQLGEHAVGHALLCCSLAEPYEWQDGTRHVSKLVAAIITRERLG